jgi:hypothetical protein
MSPQNEPGSTAGSILATNCMTVSTSVDAFAFEQARQAGTRYIGIDVLPGNIKQVVERQVQRLA